MFTLGTGMVRIFVNKIGRHLHQNTGNYDRQEPEQAEFPTAESETGTHEDRYDGGADAERADCPKPGFDF